MSEDVAVVGSGPNGLAAAVIMARAGLRVAVYESAANLGGGCRSTPLFDRDVVHDVCSAVHPMAGASRFFREFDLAGRGVALDNPVISYGHPLGGARSGLAFRDLERTCRGLGRDGAAWRSLMAPLVRGSRQVVDVMLSDLRRPPAHPLVVALLGTRVLRHGTRLATRQFRGSVAPAMLAGVAAHAAGALPSLPGAAVGLLLAHLAHGSGWPVVRGGSQRIVDALIADLIAHGGTVSPATPITDIRELRHARVVLLDLAPRGLLDIAGDLMPARYRRSLAAFRHGAGASKVDFLVSEPIPWSDPDLAAAGTVHLSGAQRATFAAESAVAAGNRQSMPYVLLAQQYVADPDRCRPGRYPIWAYCHVPNGDDRDPVATVTAVIERYAPGFGDTVLASQGIPAAEMSVHNANYVGGDIAAGAVDLRQSLLRPVPRWDPYRTALSGVYLCSASTPPGPGVHGMCGYHAARSALRHEFGITAPPTLGALSPHCPG